MRKLVLTQRFNSEKTDMVSEGALTLLRWGRDRFTSEQWPVGSCRLIPARGHAGGWVHMPYKERGVAY